jgi:hypothetical protein
MLQAGAQWLAYDEQHAFGSCACGQIPVCASFGPGLCASEDQLFSRSPTILAWDLRSQGSYPDARRWCRPWGISLKQRIPLLEYLNGTTGEGEKQNSRDWHEKMQQIATEHPQLRVLGTVEILPEFLDLLYKSE